ncbi:Cysteine-rich domain-containing protein [Desulfonema limicola]|uniref:Cysteine-rich domain-containing protein n=1 Tax=Desulfonema limicola TaxID=45656 RepID=A0A975GH34_9BACT|nr:CoB--CoM heterodisulfide reductase iron-sulfur subunit B family protein [Desulfonema limicola]QTA80864.1 Cysteine-rich domain-containing protein [Desulfonema limicola]
MEIAYYPGCSLQQSSSLYDHQTRMIFSRLGVELKEIEDWNCCGATSAGKVDDFLAVVMPARNIGIAESAGFTEMVIPCSACYSRTIVAQKRMQDNPELRDEINSGLTAKIKGSIRISTIMEVFLNHVSPDLIKQKLTHKFRGLKPVCYYGCMQTRFPYNVPASDNVENPQAMETLLKLFGIRALDWNYKTYCCGASAAVNDPDTALNLMAKIMKEAAARGANCFVTTCPMCQMNLDANQEAFCKKHDIKERLPVYFITELAGAAFGISPEDMQVDRHFIDSMTLLKELEQNEHKDK